MRVCILSVMSVSLNFRSKMKTVTVLPGWISIHVDQPRVDARGGPPNPGWGCSACAKTAMAQFVYIVKQFHPQIWATAGHSLNRQLTYLTYPLLWYTYFNMNIIFSGQKVTYCGFSYRCHSKDNSLISWWGKDEEYECKLVLQGFVPLVGVQPNFHQYLFFLLSMTFCATYSPKYDPKTKPLYGD